MKSEVYHQLFCYIKKQWLSFCVMIVMAILTVTAQLIIPIQIGRIVNVLVGQNQVDFNEVWRQVAWLIGYTVVASLTLFFQTQLTNRITYRLTYQLRKDLFYKIHRIPLRYIDRHSYGDIVSRIINDVDFTGNGILKTFTSLFTGIATIIGIIGIMLSLNVAIGLIVIILTPVSVVVSSLIANRTYHYFQDQMHLRGQLGSYIDEMATSQMLVKAFAYEEQSQQEFEEINDKIHQNGIWSQFYGALINPSARLINSMVYAAVGIYGAFSVIQGHLSVGILTSFLTYANQYTRPFNDISAIINELQTALAAAARLFHFLQVEEESKQIALQSLETVEGNVDVKDVSFSYIANQPLIRDFSLKVDAGETVAIVGPTGAGKTTLINLLMRFYDVNQGSIQIDGRDIYEVNRDQLRQQFGMVLQDSWIFEGTVRENIAYGKKDATEQEIIHAAQMANVDRLIQNMDEGYNTMLEEDGSNLSMGQKQLICIARIMLTDPNMIILDEATSSIDTLTEHMVQNAFDIMMSGKTSFVVAHRLSTIKNATTILVLDHGNIIEQGTHEALLSKKGFYYQLYQSQFEDGMAH